MKATTSKTTPQNPNENSKENEQVEGLRIDAKELGDDLVKIFGTAELTQMDGTPTRPDKLQALVDSVKKSGIASCSINGDGMNIRYPFSGKPTETYL